MNADASHTTVVILAAGASKRMGTPKQLLEWSENNTLLGHAVVTAMRINPLEVIVVLGAFYEQIKNELKDLSITILKNEEWRSGLGTSIACAAEYILESPEKISNIIITLSDQPFITAEYLNSMCSEFVPNEKCIIASSYQNRAFGVPAIFDISYLKELTELHDDYGARNLLKKHEPFIKTLKPPRENPDIDTPEDYKNNFNSNF
ncbi:nucleotidyltransferase family protein [Gaetbulibacter sp. M240]|uniref:nucleotidyltransferase family protein n=1 Tax=Gaetbulibacter sp. M240 TaxID=3126511 RepID=UPI00374F1E00